VNLYIFLLELQSFPLDFQVLPLDLQLHLLDFSNSKAMSFDEFELRAEIQKIEGLELFWLRLSLRSLRQLVN
jgi:hypothetical protein